MNNGTIQIEVRANDPEARSLLVAAVKWIRRIEERPDEVTPLFLDNCDVKPLRKKIESYLDKYEK